MPFISAKEINAAGLESSSDQQLSFYSIFARKWYRVRIKALPPERYMLVWLEDITDQKMDEFNMIFEKMRDRPI
jgi:hypothetical protein